MKKIAILTNSNCGRGDGHRAIQHARRTLWGWPLEIFAPSSREELLETCVTLTPSEYEGVVVVGGDGTIHHVLKSMRANGIRDVPLYPFPAGTANDLATELGLRPDWEQVQTLLDQRSIERIDCLTVNDSPFATIAGLGAGSRLTTEYNSRRESSTFFRALSYRLRSHVYTALSAKTLLLSGDYFHRLHIRGESFDEKLKTPVVFICNQPRLGARMTVAPDARNNDGRFHVVIVPRTRKHRLITGLIALQAGVVPQDFIVFSTARLFVRDLDGRDIQVFGDGETLLSAPELRFLTEPRSLHVYSGRLTGAGLISNTGSKFKVPEEALI